METNKSPILENFEKIVLIMLAILLIGNIYSGCSNSRLIVSLRKELDTLSVQVDRIPTKPELEIALKRSVVQSLLWEDAVDKKQMSIGEVAAIIERKNDSIKSTN